MHWTRETANELTQCEEFLHLGGVVSADGFCDSDVDRRIGLAAGIVRIYTAFGKQMI